MWIRWFKFAPDDLGGAAGAGSQATGGGASAGAAVQAAPASSPGDGAAAGAAQSASAASVSGTSGAQTGSQAQQAAQTFRDIASQHGFDLRQYQDDASAMGAVVNLIRQAQQQQQLAQYGQQYLQHAAPFQQYLAQMQQLQAQRAQQNQQNQQQSWWKAPEFDPSWRQMLTTDAQGNIVGRPGAPPDLPAKFMAALQHQQQFLDKFAFDPLGSIKPGVEEVARAVAQQMIQQHLGGYQEQQFANSWVQQNSSWLYARDGAGNPMIDQSGRPVLSDYGRKFAGYVQEAQGMGIRDVAQQQKYALQNVQFEYMVSQYSQRGAAAGAQQQQTPVSQGDAAKQAFLQQAAAAPRNGGGTYGAQAAASQPGPKNQRELASVMSAALAASGFGPGTAIQ